MAEQIDAEVKGIFEEAFERYKAGEKTYGVFDKEKDPRDFIREAEEELLDTIVYAAFEIARIRALNNKLKSLMEDLSKRLSGPDKNSIERQALINEADRIDFR